MSKSAIACACTLVLMSCSSPGDGPTIGASESAISAQPERGIRVQNWAEPAARVTSFGTMYGVDGPFMSDTSIRGVLGDELPWTIAHVDGTLNARGHLTLEVKGLVFTDDDVVPPEKRGINDEKQFRALVSCIAEGTDGKMATVNVMTPGFQATSTGDAHIDTVIDLPKQCVAPIVFIMSGSEDKWFAVTGVETE